MRLQVQPGHTGCQLQQTVSPSPPGAMLDVPPHSCHCVQLCHVLAAAARATDRARRGSGRAPVLAPAGWSAWPQTLPSGPLLTHTHTHTHTHATLIRCVTAQYSSSGTAVAANAARGDGVPAAPSLSSARGAQHGGALRFTDAVEPPIVRSSACG